MLPFFTWVGWSVVVSAFLVNALGRSESVHVTTVDNESDSVIDAPRQQARDGKLLVRMDTFRIEQVIRNLGVTYT
jgi:hypothetical protein